MVDTFPDRRERMFGRAADVRYLIERAHSRGVTIVVGRPLMGKTWALMETARELLDEGRFFVGYHESTATESSHLLYAVSDLYARWLQDSSMREQAISLWGRHKEEVVPRIGKVFGKLIEKLGSKYLPGGAASLVRSAFDALAEAQKDLLSGGIQRAQLPYEQALSLVELIAKIGKRDIVLILDAWEKSPSGRGEFAVLEAFLKHEDAWPHMHVFLAVRNPDLDVLDHDGNGFRLASALNKISRAAQVYELGAIDQQSPTECARIANYVRETIPAAQRESDDDVLKMIDGYPGVLNFWASEFNRRAMRTHDDLAQTAQNAHVLRYVDLDRQLEKIRDTSSLLVAARLALFFRFGPKAWSIFRNVLLKDQAADVLDALVDAKILVDESFPSYGHDTRHVAARDWFFEHSRPVMRRALEQLIDAVAAEFTGSFEDADLFSDFLRLHALQEWSELTDEVQLSETARCLTRAAQVLLGGSKVDDDYQIDRLYVDAIRKNPSTTPLIARMLLHRAELKHDHGFGWGRERLHDDNQSSEGTRLCCVRSPIWSTTLASSAGEELRFRR